MMMYVPDSTPDPCPQGPPSMRIVCCYVLFAVLFFFFLEPLLRLFISDPALIDLLQQKRGWLLLALTGIFLYLLCRHYEKALAHKDEAIARLALYEPLTALPNRKHFRERLAESLVEARRQGLEVEVTYLNIDRFRSVVRTLGLAAGRRLLQDIAVRLSGCLAPGEFLAHAGGDDFTLLKADIGQPEKAEGLASRLLEAIRFPFTYLGHDLHLTASIGIALYPHDGEDSETLLKSAYAAMNRVKEMGGDHYQFYFSDLSEYSTGSLILENRMRKALAAEEFILLYQPQLDLVHGRITGMEALVSWKHPAHPELSPSEFIPLAEETGLIEPMGEWILRTACIQNRRWQESGLPPLKVSVNVSARQFYRANLAETVTAVLAETGLGAEWLALEITETVLMQDMEGAISTLNGLKDIGVGVTIDDFGTGYSSLNYLKRFPVQTLKLDRSFVANVPSDAEDKAITAAVIAMAHAMKLDVVAEGVEREEQRSCLAAKGCDKIQGFLVSRPLAAEDFAKFFRTRELAMGTR